MESLRRFDEAYLAFYPYLEGYVSSEELEGKKVLEIGLGYGTLGQLLASKDCDYYGLDIVQGPVAMMRYCLNQLGQDGERKVITGSVLEIPHEDASFDYVYTIGTLHHTGNLSKAISEVYRVLVPGGKAIVMLYNRHSFRQLVRVPLMRLRTLLSNRRRSHAERTRALYDTNAQGEAAPHTDFTSPAEARQFFKKFSQVKIDIRNFGNFRFRGITIIPRAKLLNNMGRVLGLDLYITATK